MFVDSVASLNTVSKVVLFIHTMDRSLSGGYGAASGYHYSSNCVTIHTVSGSTAVAGTCEPGHCSDTDDDDDHHHHCHRKPQPVDLRYDSYTIQRKTMFLYFLQRKCKPD